MSGEKRKTSSRSDSSRREVGNESSDRKRSHDKDKALERKAQEERKMFQWEVEESAARDSGKDMGLFSVACQQVREDLARVKECKESKKSHAMADIYESRVHGSLQIVVLRKLNRLAQLRAHSARAQTDAARDKADNYHLKLQGLHYEVGHLQREVEKCLQYQSADEALELEPEADTPQEIRDSVSTELDGSHEKRKAQLLWELKQRETLNSQLEESKKELKSVSKEIGERKSSLAKLGPVLEKVMTSVKPVQELLGSADLPLLRGAECSSIHLLPYPLHLLFTHCQAIKEVYGASCLTDATVEGDADAAKVFINRAAEEEEDSDSEGEEDSGARKKTSKKSRGKNMPASSNEIHPALKPHPLTVTLTVPLEEGSSLKLVFSYLHLIRVVTLKVSLQEDQSRLKTVSEGDLMSSDSLLNCLYAGDDGSTSLSASTQQELARRNLESSFPYGQRLGRPYNWVQSVCGLGNAATTMTSPPSLGKREQEAGSSRSGQDVELFRGVEEEPLGGCTSGPLTATRVVLLKVKERMRTRKALQSQLRDLENGVVSTSYSKTMSPVVSMNPTSGLHSWASMSYEEFVSIQAMMSTNASNDDSSPYLPADKDHVFYKAVVKHAAAASQLTACVSLGPSYPHCPSLVCLAFQTKNKVTLTRANDLGIRMLESEVNLFLNSEGHAPPTDYYLANQLHRLLLLFDVYVETGRSESGAVDSGKVIPRAFRGPGRSAPYCYSSMRKFYTHR